MKKIIFIIIFISFLFIVNFVFADSKIIINEFLIDPQPQSVEIFNSGSESADISGWIIDDDGSSSGTYPIPENSIVYPNACLVFSSNFYLNKSSADTIRLINNSQQLIDSFSYKSSSGSGISYLRQPDGTNNWATGSANLGFYNSNEEQTCLFPTLTPTPESILTPTLTLAPTITPIIIPTIGSEDPTPIASPEPTAEAGTINNIYLSEVMVNPSTGEKEWVEIYNDNDFSVSLNNWYIDDLENVGSSPKVFSLEIEAKSYGVFDLPSLIFNNDGDTVRLLDFNKNLKDDFEYSKSEQGKTLGRTWFESDDFCLQEPSKNSANNPCINLTTITSVCTGQACLSPTISKFQGFINQTPTKNILQTKTPIIRGRETPSTLLRINRLLQYAYPTSYPVSSDVLGLSNELIIEPSNSKSLISLLSFLSFSYSLLTIISILFKMKLSYGKNKNFYSPSLRSS